MNVFKKIFRSLHILSGEDYEIIRTLDVKEINRSFNWIGFCVLIISISCLFSATNFIFHVFEGSNRFLSIPIGLFWGFIVTTIYILLLYTITPPLLIDKRILKRKKSSNATKAWVISKEYYNKMDEWLSLSMLLRIGFILIFALIIAQPLNVFLFGRFVKNDIFNYKTIFKSKLLIESDQYNISLENEIYKDFVRKNNLQLSKDSIDKMALETLKQKIIADQNFVLETKKINKIIESKSPKRINKNNLYQTLNEKLNLQIENDYEFVKKIEEIEILAIKNPDFLKYLSETKKNIEEKNASHQKLVATIDENDFYLRQIVFLNEKNLLAWLINLLFCGIFIVPIYLKYHIRKIKPKNTLTFYDHKKLIEEKIVTDYYKNFKNQFSGNLQSFNRKSMERIYKNIEPKLAVLEKINPQKAHRLKAKTLEKMNKNFEFYEKYADAPFNLKKKEENKKVETTENFINECHQ